MNPTPQQLLKQYFGYDQFRPMQLDIIEAVLAGKDTLALLPTGGGKSICYQIPGLALPGLCLVITPLIALMNDQVSQLRRRNIPALAIHGDMGFFDVKKAFENCSQGVFRFLFLSPERLQTRLFREYLPGLPINLVAVDEAHCISAWGYDFRPPYLKIADMREDLPNVPFLALTASATPDVQADICNKLAFNKNHLIFRQSFEKANLSFSCFDTPTKFQKLLTILQNVPGTALVYCRNRRRTKEIATLLQQHQIDCTYYHAGLEADTRRQRQDDWIQNKVRVMACTNAFGMGIDKPDVRVVVHVDMPDNPEAYYQEAGRAGRDGKKAYAVLLFTPADLQSLETLPDQKFPALDVVRNVYDHICNYLQIPVHSGAEHYYNFDLLRFCEGFKHDALLVNNVMHTLQQAGYISYAEQVFMPSKIGFTAGKDYLLDIEKTYPALESLIKTLLRTYEGIFDNSVGISERLLANILKTHEVHIVSDLQQLAKMGVLQYDLRKDSPQIYFLYDRVPAAELTIDYQLYIKRKAEYKFRIGEMIGYATNVKTCRSVVLRKYFADESQIRPCGICDVCLGQKAKTPLQHQALQDFSRQVVAILPQCRTLSAIQKKLQLKNYELNQVIDYLVAEELIDYGHEGELVLRAKT